MAHKQDILSSNVQQKIRPVPCAEKVKVFEVRPHQPQYGNMTLAGHAGIAINEKRPHQPRKGIGIPQVRGNCQRGLGLEGLILFTPNVCLIGVPKEFHFGPV